MSDLSPKSRALIDAARAAGGSTSDDRARVLARVAGKVGLSAGAAGAVSTASNAVAASGAPVTMSASKLIAIVVMAATAGTAVTVGTVALVRARRGISPSSVVVAPAPTRGAGRGATPQPIAVVPVPVASPASAPTVTPVSYLATARPSRSNVRSPVAHLAPIEVVAPRAEPSAASANGLADELSLLRGARAAIRSHDAATALALLEQHAARFPSGMLREEREATGVIALCELGRVADARAAARGFFDNYPHSPHAARVRASCAGETQ